MTDEFQKQLAYGKNFEERFATYLINKGWNVIPYFLLNKVGAPLMLGKIDYILPDILAFKDGGGLWFECKRKTRMPDGYTGYKLKNHEHYKMVQDISGIGVFVVFEDNDIWYGNYVNTLDNCKSTKIIKIQGDKNIMFHYPSSLIKIDHEK